MCDHASDTSHRVGYDVSVNICLYKLDTYTFGCWYTVSLHEYCFTTFPGVRGNEFFTTFVSLFYSSSLLTRLSQVVIIKKNSAKGNEFFATFDSSSSFTVTSRNDKKEILFGEVNFSRRSLVCFIRLLC